MKFILAIVLLICTTRSGVVKFSGYANSDCSGDEFTVVFEDTEDLCSDSCT